LNSGVNKKGGTLEVKGKKGREKDDRTKDVLRDLGTDSAGKAWGGGNPNTWERGAQSSGLPQGLKQDSERGQGGEQKKKR